MKPLRVRMETTMKIKDIAFTVIPVSDLKASRAFYEGLLGLTATSVYEKDGMGMIEYEVGAATLAIGAGAPFFKPTKEGGAVAFEVENFGEAIARLKSAKVAFVMDGYETPVCHMAIFRDPDGNQLMVHQKKATK
jgi:predicted enzyme related to lactoylglutathione lyase